MARISIPTWYKWEGKPLMLVHHEQIPPEVAANFTIRESWAWAGRVGWFADGHDKWTWLDNFPQKAGWHDTPDHPEEASVCIAQHATTSIGRSSLAQQEPPEGEQKPELGLCFNQQFEQALMLNPQVIFVNGWDEWTAGCFTATAKDPSTFAGHPQKPGDKFFVDEYSPEFSRDIEPSVNLGDNYLYQFVAFARRFKGVRPVPAVESRPIHLNGSFAAWQQVQPEFRDTVGDPVHRDSPGGGREHYVNNTGRNDLVVAKVSTDANNIYFYMRTKDPITPHTDPNWMMLFIDMDNDPKTGWLGYDFVVNREDVRDDTTTVQQNVDRKYQWQTVARVKYKVFKDQIEIAIPLNVLGIGIILPDQINFKWADNIQQTGDVSDFTLNGDAAPNDRYYFQARLADH